MKYVYVLQSINHAEQHYVGLTADLRGRLDDHNAGKSPHTSKYMPWRFLVAIRLEDDTRAAVFERYLKTGSGRAFIKRHFL